MVVLGERCGPGFGSGGCGLRIRLLTQGHLGWRVQPQPDRRRPVGRRRVRREARAQGGVAVGRDPTTNTSPLGSMVSCEAATRIGTLLEDAVGKGARFSWPEADWQVPSCSPPSWITGRWMRARPGGSLSGRSSRWFAWPALMKRSLWRTTATTACSAAVFGRDIGARFERGQRIESGICHINAATVHELRTHAVRRRQGQRIRPVRGEGGRPRVHRPAVDHRADRRPALPDFEEQRPCPHTTGAGPPFAPRLRTDLAGDLQPPGSQRDEPEILHPRDADLLEALELELEDVRAGRPHRRGGIVVGRNR